MNWQHSVVVVEKHFRDGLGAEEIAEQMKVSHAAVLFVLFSEYETLYKLQAERENEIVKRFTNMNLM